MMNRFFKSTNIEEIKTGNSLNKSPVWRTDTGPTPAQGFNYKSAQNGGKKHVLYKQTD